MGTNQQRDLSKWATNGMLVVGLGGGMPYVVTLQTELKNTHDTVIRLEEQNKNLLQRLDKMEIEQSRMRDLMEKYLRGSKVAILRGNDPADQ